MKKYLKPWIFGIAAGIIVVSAEVLFNIFPPSAYAFCLACHVRDFVNSVINTFSGTRFEISEIAGKALMLTSPAVILGAFIGAKISGEYRFQKPQRPVLSFILGFAIMIIGIIIFGCPTRIIIRAGYGEFYGIIAMAGLILGAVIGTLAIKFWYRLKG
jgi:hypothetical protein